jgi:hypothetical protein
VPSFIWRKLTVAFMGTLLAARSTYGRACLLTRRS